jgi:pimeloyl-ACP methyl ester carboxylesterase
VLAPDFIGYGQSDTWPGARVFTGQADVHVVLELAKQSERPLHMVGHSYGAVMALQAARELGTKVKSLVLVEPVAFNLLRVEKRAEWAEVERLGVQVLTAVADGDDRAAAAHFMRYWLGRLRWFIAPEKFKAAITATIRKVALEFMIALDADASLADYREVAAPTLPNVKLEILKGAGHMSPFTHPSALNRSILAFLASRR